ncbi:DUF2218 domain-containing protein [Catenulispora rubra]|uniref:DUF2218 domain-containing protein n=1 Tax=Catenulispora rubra TaxID=280293 RepID=UPI0018925ECD|nr:DUF2218 domain-containing protein [Catenulispora rubra]
MPASQAHVRTDRARRYLAQLCDHGSRLGRLAGHRPRSHGAGTAPPAARSEHSDTDGVIDFGWGRCTLHAAGQALILTAEADDEQSLQRLQEGVAYRLERIGRRDQLTVTWQQPPPGTSSQESADEPE